MCFFSLCMGFEPAIEYNNTTNNEELHAMHGLITMYFVFFTFFAAQLYIAGTVIILVIHRLMYRVAQKSKLKYSICITLN